MGTGTEVTPGMVRIAELITTQRCVQHGAGMITALNQAADWARHLENDPSTAREASHRASVYASTVARIERAMTDMEHDLAEGAPEEPEEPGHPLSGESSPVPAPPADLPPGVVPIQKRDRRP